MDDRAELEELRRLDELERRAAGGPAAPAPNPVAAMPDMDPSEGMNAGEKMLVGAGAAFDRARTGLASLIPGLGDFAASKAEEAEVYRRNHPGGWATAGEIGADIAMSAAPVGLGAQGLTKAAQMARMGRVAPLAGTVAANAGWNAATAPENRGTAAAFGGAGAAAGAGVARVLAGAVKPTEAAARMMAQGQPMTLGQAAGTGSRIGRAEEMLSSNPAAGLMINPARTRAQDAAAKQAVDLTAQRVVPGFKPRAGVSVANHVEDAHRAISGVYDEILPKINVPALDAKMAGFDAVNAAMETAHTVSDAQRARLDSYLSRRLTKAELPEVVDGRTLQQIASEMASTARALGRSTDAEQKIASRMWNDAAHAFRQSALKNHAPTPHEAEMLGQAGTAWRELLAVEKALKSSGGERIHSRALNKALAAANIKTGPLAEHTADMLATMPNAVPNSGTADRALLNALPMLATGGGLYMLGLPGAAGLMATTKPGVKLMTGMYTPQQKLAAALRGEVLGSVPGQIGRAAFTPRGEDQ